MNLDPKFFLPIQLLNDPFDINVYIVQEKGFCLFFFERRRVFIKQLRDEMHLWMVKVRYLVNIFTLNF